MKNLLKTAVVAAVLSACSSENVPTPQKLGQDLQTLTPSTQIAVAASEDFAVPTGAQVIQKQSVFKVLDNVYSKQSNRIIVPKGALITGLYSNSGTTCKIAWQSMYVNEDDYKNNMGTPQLQSIVQETRCDPVKGIKEDQRILIRVNNGNNFN